MEKNSANSNTVHLINKKLGETPNEAILRFKSQNPEYEGVSMTYAGRLDPMAEGLLLVLSGEEIKNKEKYLSLNKVYEFDILWGFETDTLDILGMQVESKKLKVQSRIPDAEKLKKIIKKSTRKFEQLYPIYSSRPVNGKSLFEWARAGRISEVLIPKHEVEIFEVKFVKRKEIKKEDLLNEVNKKVSLVKGDFRQEEILKKWGKTIKDSSPKSFVIDKIKIRVSSGFYVRQFVSDLAKDLKTYATTFHIKRTKIGDYSL